MLHPEHCHCIFCLAKNLTSPVVSVVADTIARVADARAAKQNQALQSELEALKAKLAQIQPSDEPKQAL